MRKLGGSSCSLADTRGPRLRCLSSVSFGFAMAQPERRYDLTAVTRAGAYRFSNRRCIGGWGVLQSWIRRQGWNAGNESGWLMCWPSRRSRHAPAVGPSRSDRPPSRSASKMPTPTVSLPSPTGWLRARTVPVQRQRNAVPALSSSRPTEEPTPPQEPTLTSVGNERAGRAVTDPRGDHPESRQSLQRRVHRPSPGR